MGFLEKNSNGIVYMTAPNITVPHAFTTRWGGVSDGVFDSLNLGVNRGDRREHVCENYDLICRELGTETGAIVCSQQIHSARIRVVTREACGKLFAPEPVPVEADGLITNDTDTALTVFTADCVPVLLYDPVRDVIGAVHAGWRGTVADIAGAAIRKMSNAFGCHARDIRAAIGPCISKCCFETGGEVADALGNVLGTEAETCFSPKENKFMVDLKAANRLLLLRAGIDAGNIEISGECTYCEHDKYWSHRYTNGIRGSQAAIILLKGNAPQ